MVRESRAKAPQGGGQGDPRSEAGRWWAGPAGNKAVDDANISGRGRPFPPLEAGEDAVCLSNVSPRCSRIELLNREKEKV